MMNERRAYSFEQGGGLGSAHLGIVRPDRIVSVGFRAGIISKEVGRARSVSLIVPQCLKN